MIVFLLLVIIACLLFGGAALLRFGAGAIRGAFLLLFVALIFGLIAKVPVQAFLWTALAVAGGIAVSFYIVFRRAADDDAILASTRGQELRAMGYTAQQTVEIVRSGAIVPAPTPASEPLPASPTGAAASPAAPPRPSPRTLIQDDLMLPIRIEYIDAEGEISTRKVTVHSAWGRHGIVDRLDGWCAKRRAERSFMLSGIMSLKDLETGQVWNDADDWFESRRYEDVLDDL